MNWDDYLRLWGAHARTAAHKRRWDKACAEARKALAVADPWYCALSGGKDGVALAAVVREACGPDIMLAHAHTDLNTPGMLETAEATAEALDMDLDVFEPEEDIWHWLRAWPAAYSLREPQHRLEFDKLFASGNMLVAYQYANGYTGAFSGMRAEESRGRRMNRIFRGHLYQLSKDASWMAQPIVDWSARDVFACCVSHGLPIHPYYRLALEQFDLDPESPGSRVDMVIPHESATRSETTLACRVLYPDLYRRIVAVRPEFKE